MSLSFCTGMNTAVLNCCKKSARNSKHTMQTSCSEDSAGVTYGLLNLENTTTCIKIMELFVYRLIER